MSRRWKVRAPGAALPALALCACGDAPVVPGEGSPEPPEPPVVVHGPPTAFVDVTVLPMTGEGALPDRTVLVRDGVIEALGTTDEVAVPDDAVVVEGGGRWLLPGLADLHTHVGTNYSEFIDVPPPAEELQSMAEGQLLLYLANGVTTILNVGDFGEPLLRWRREVLEAAYPGPTVYAALWARGPPGTPDGGPGFRSVTGEADAEALVRQAARDGWHFVKIYNWTPAAAARAILRDAPAAGLGVVGHLPRTLEPRETLERGLDLVAHSEAYFWTHFGFRVDPSLVPEAVAMTAASGAAVTPTLGIVETVAQVWGGDDAGIAAFWARPETRYMHWSERALHEEGIAGPRWHPRGSAPGGYDPVLELVAGYTRDFHDAGVPLVAGTDSPTVLGAAGFSMHRELAALERLGLTPVEVLRIATRNGGDFLGGILPDETPFGVVRPGARADLLLLEADPTVDLANLQRRVAVMARGLLYTEAELQARLEALAGAYAAGGPPPRP